MRRQILACCMCLAFAACDAREPASRDSSNAVQAAGSERRPPRPVPELLHGRWARTIADCVAADTGGQGLVVLSADTLRSYESVGRLTDTIEWSPRRIVGTFAFTGEGASWRRRLLLSLSDDGRTLIAEERGDDAARDTSRYLRCPGPGS